MSGESEDGSKNALAVPDDLNALVASTATGLVNEAGLGSEDLSFGDVTLPRVSVLQPLSKPVAEELNGAKPGCLWVTPFMRPGTVDPKTDGMKFIVVKIYPSQRKWIPLDEGGGIDCDASTGKLIAAEAKGLTGAKLSIVDGKVTWEGGRPTNNCHECVFGPGASAAASGKPSAPGSGGNGWLPKIVVVDGVSHKLEDKARAPRCQAGVDVLALVVVPAFNGLGAELVPAFISFARSSFKAGRSLAGMIKMSPGQPAWSKVYELKTKKVTNDKGSWFTLNVGALGFTSETFARRARDLYEQTKTVSYRADFSDADDIVGEENLAADVGGEQTQTRPDDDAPAPGDQF